MGKGEATFSCLHRFTGNQICAIPCNGEDDLCRGHLDEDPLLCHKRNPTPYIASFLLTLVIIGCVLGEILYRGEFQRVQERGGHEARDSLLLEFLDRVTGEKSPDFNLLKPVFGQIHSREKIPDLVAILDANFDSYELKEIFQLVHRLELWLHEENPVRVELCLMDALGTNTLAEKFMDLVQFSFFTRANLKLKELFKGAKSKIGSRVANFLSSSSMLLLKVSLYYLDFIKDSALKMPKKSTPLF